MSDDVVDVSVSVLGASTVSDRGTRPGSSPSFTVSESSTPSGANASDLVLSLFLRLKQVPVANVNKKQKVTHNLFHKRKC